MFLLLSFAPYLIFLISVGVDCLGAGIQVLNCGVSEDIVDGASQGYTRYFQPNTSADSTALLSSHLSRATNINISLETYIDGR